MAGKITTNSVVLGDSATDTQNFILKTNVDGTATLARGAAGTLGTVFGVNGSSAITGATLVTPALGTPASGVLTNCTGVPAAALPAGSVLQVKTSTFDGYVSTSVTGTVPTTITFGYQLFSLSFTPISATSTILVQTSTVSIGEATNFADQFWLALWDGATFIAANSGTVNYVHFASNLNAGYFTLNNSYTSGSTSTRTIQVRAGANAVGVIQINGNPSSTLTGSSARMQMTVWEIAA